MKIAFAIILDRASDEQLAQAHAIIKKRADGWWHHFANVWIVGGGGSSSGWRDALAEATKTGSSSVLVLDLPSPGSRLWAYFGPESKKRAAWLSETYTGIEKK